MALSMLVRSHRYGLVLFVAAVVIALLASPTLSFLVVPCEASRRYTGIYMYVYLNISEKGLIYSSYICILIFFLGCFLDVFLGSFLSSFFGSFANFFGKEKVGKIPSEILSAKSKNICTVVRKKGLRVSGGLSYQTSERRVRSSIESTVVGCPGVLLKAY